MTDAVTETNLGRKEFISATDERPSLREARGGSSGRNQEAGTDAEAVEEHCLGLASPDLLRLPVCPGMVPFIVDWASLINQRSRKDLIDMPVGQSDGIPRLRSLFPGMSGVFKPIQPMTFIIPLMI